MNETSKRIAADASLVAAATLLSRVLGFFRDMILAGVLGAGPAADAFYVAYRVPNMLRRLFAEGSMTMAFVPVFSRVKNEQGREAAYAMARSVAFWLVALLCVVTAAAYAFAEPLTLLIAPGFEHDPALFETTARLLRIVFPYIIEISLVALCMGILNSLGHFLTPALATSELNTIVIAGCGVAWLFGLDPAATLAWSIVIGGLGQVYMQLPALRRFEFSFVGPFRIFDKGVGEMVRLMGPTVFGAAIYQISVLVGTLLASFLPTGSVSALYYADRLVQFPLGLFATAIGTVALPSLANLAAREDLTDFRSTLSSSLNLTLFVTLPATVGLFVLAEPIVSLLFERGAFGPQQVDAAATALKAYAVGLPAFAVLRPLVSACYALRETRLPVIVGAVSLAATVAASLALMFPFAHVGLALATSISSYVNVAGLVWALNRRFSLRPNVASTLVRSCAASLVVAAAALYTPGGNALRVGLILVWAVLYFATGLALRIPEARMLMNGAAGLVSRLRRRRTA